MFKCLNILVDWKYHSGQEYNKHEWLEPKVRQIQIQNEAQIYTLSNQ